MQDFCKSSYEKRKFLLKEKEYNKHIRLDAKKGGQTW